MVSYGFPFVLSLTFLHFLATTVQIRDKSTLYTCMLSIMDWHIAADFYGVRHSVGLFLLDHSVHALGTAHSVQRGFDKLHFGYLL